MSSPRLVLGMYEKRRALASRMRVGSSGLRPQGPLTLSCFVGVSNRTMQVSEVRPGWSRPRLPEASTGHGLLSRVKLIPTRFSAI